MTRAQRVLQAVILLGLVAIVVNILSAYSLLVRSDRRLVEATRALERMRKTVIELEERLREIEDALAPVAPVKDIALRYNPRLGDQAAEIAIYIVAEARRHGLDPYLVAAVVAAESGFRQHAVSHCGARGLMQLMPRTARALGVDPGHIGENIRGGVRYLRAQIERFGDVRLALAAYNAGPTRVSRGGVSRGTRAYVARVQNIAGGISNA